MKPQVRLTAILAIAALVVYLLPLVAHGFPEQDAMSIMYVGILLVNPLMNLGMATYYGYHFGVKLWFAVLIASLFIPATVIVYNATALFYGVIYLIIGLVGVPLGSWIGRLRRGPVED